jgi:hypothetical protein
MYIFAFKSLSTGSETSKICFRRVSEPAGSDSETCRILRGLITRPISSPPLMFWKPNFCKMKKPLTFSEPIFPGVLWPQRTWDPQNSDPRKFQTCKWLCRVILHREWCKKIVGEYLFLLLLGSGSLHLEKFKSTSEWFFYSILFNTF